MSVLEGYAKGVLTVVWHWTVLDPDRYSRMSSVDTLKVLTTLDQQLYH